MPHIDTSGAETPDPTFTEPAETMDTAAAQRVEQERLARRATLRKLGFGAGLAAFSLFGVDDFARMVGQRLQRNAHDNKTALAVAKEFQSAGIALAEDEQYNPSGPCGGCVSGDKCVPGPYQECIKCCDGCTCAKVQDKPCSSFVDPSQPSNLATCQACCRDRNPGTGIMATIAYNSCVSNSKCS